ncbi:MAG: 50S ribosomal protein L22 [Chthoniobacterales bacterium]
MQVKSIYRYAKISPFKAREVTREIQGLPALEALAQLKLIPKKAAPLIAKTLKSAIANAEQNNNIRPGLLVIKEATIGEAPTLKRITPKARGSAGPIRKRSSHIRIILTDEIPIISRVDHKEKKNTVKKSGRIKKSSTATAEGMDPETEA